MVSCVHSLTYLRQKMIQFLEENGPLVPNLNGFDHLFSRFDQEHHLEEQKTKVHDPSDGWRESPCWRSSVSISLPFSTTADAVCWAERALSTFTKNSFDPLEREEELCFSSTTSGPHDCKLTKRTGYLSQKKVGE